MSHLKRWGAVWILLVLFLGSWVGQFVSQGIEFANEAKDHGVAASWGEYWPMFWAATFENWQSEFLQLAVQALLIASVLGQPRLFRADASADKEDVDKILVAIGELKRSKS